MGKDVCRHLALSEKYSIENVRDSPSASSVSAVIEALPENVFWLSTSLGEAIASHMRSNFQNADKVAFVRLMIRGGVISEPS